MKKMLLALAALAALSTPAFADKRPMPVFQVIQHDVRVPFSNYRVSGYNVARDDSLIIQGDPNEWYRATVWEPCKYDLRWSFDHIALDTRPDGTLDRFSTVIVHGQRCPIQTLDRIQRPARGSGAY